MRVHERAAQIWSVLALAARNRQVLTYPLTSRLVGVPQIGLGKLLETIQSYCLLKKLPPLTMLVISSETGMPGTGFVAASDIPRTQQEVFAFDWLPHGAPSEDVLSDSVAKLPSNAVPQPRDG